MTMSQEDNISTDVSLIIASAGTKMLTTKRPTPTTVLYTVSTHSLSTTFAGHLVTAFLLVLRLLATLSLLLALYLEVSTYYASTSALTQLSMWNALEVLISTLPTRPWRLAICALTSYFVLRKRHTEESLLVIQGLGLQTTTSSTFYLWKDSTRFIPTSSVRDVFIHEAFKGFEVKFYLCVVVEEEESVVVVFPVSRQWALPRRDRRG